MQVRRTIRKRARVGVILPGPASPYDRDVPSLVFLFLVGAIAALALVPTRRLFLAGWSGRSLAFYFFGLVGLGLLVAELRAPARFLIPILVVVYIAPFVTARAGFARLFRRPGVTSRPPVVSRPEIRSLPGPSEVVEPRDRAGEDARPVGGSEPASAPEPASGSGEASAPEPASAPEQVGGDGGEGGVGDGSAKA